MAGITLGDKGSNKTGLSLEILKSRAFITSFINDNNLKPIIMASESWSLDENKVIYNSNIYDKSTQTWVREVEAPLKPEPSNLEVHQFFIENNLSVNQDQDSGLVTVSIRHHSPYVAKEIVDSLIVF